MEVEVEVETTLCIRVEHIKCVRLWRCSRGPPYRHYGCNSSCVSSGTSRLDQCVATETIPDAATRSPGEQGLSLCDAGLAVVLLQSGDVIVPSGVPVTLDCRMGAGFSMSSYTMLWYRQEQTGAQIEFLIKEYEKDNDRFMASLQAKENLFSITIAELQVNDSSNYYCAARHSEAQSPLSCSNNCTTAGSSCSSLSLHREKPQLSKCRIELKLKSGYVWQFDQLRRVEFEDDAVLFTSVHRNWLHVSWIATSC